MPAKRKTLVSARLEIMHKIDLALPSSLRPQSRACYLMNIKHYIGWCQKNKLTPLPATAEVAGAYISMLARLRYKRSTMNQRIAILAHVHRCLGYPEPNRTVVFRRVWDGIRRSRPAESKGRRPLTMTSIKRLVAVLPSDLRGLRDRALILTSFAGALMANELRLLKRSDIRFDESMIITVGEPRTRQINIGPGLHAATCPVQAMRDWLEAADIRSGSVFRHINVHGNLQDRGLSACSPRYILMKRCAEAGLQAEYYGMQSLRSGFYMTMAENNVDIEITAAHAGIKNVEGLYEKYYKHAYRWSEDVRSIDQRYNPFVKRKWRG